MNHNSKGCTVDHIFVHTDTAVGIESYLNFYIPIRILIFWRPCAFTYTQINLLAVRMKATVGGGDHEHISIFHLVARFTAF